MLEELTIYDAIGLIGSMIIVIAYYLAARGILPADQSHFNLINIIGGGLVMASLLVRPNLGVIVIEVMFLLIAVLAIYRNWRAQRGHTSNVLFKRKAIPNRGYERESL